MKNNHDKKIVEYAKLIHSFLKESIPDKEILDSPEKFKKFLEKEKLAKSNIFSQINKISKIADQVASGKREIHFNIDDVPSEHKRLAQSLIATIKVAIAKKENPTYGPTYQSVSQIISLILSLLSIGALLFMGEIDDKSKVKKRQFVKTVKKIGDPTKKTPKEILSWVKNIVGLIEK